MKLREPDLVLDGYKLYFERRRYGGQKGVTYTWAHVEVPGEIGEEGLPRWESLGDPWPCLRPTNAELRSAITRVVAR